MLFQILDNPINSNQPVIYAPSSYEVLTNRKHHGVFSTAKLAATAKDSEVETFSLGKKLNLTFMSIEFFSGNTAKPDDKEPLKVNKYAILYGVLNQTIGTTEAGTTVVLLLSEWTAKYAKDALGKFAVQQYKNPSSTPFALELTLGNTAGGPNTLYPISVECVPMPEGCEYYAAIPDNVTYESATDKYPGKIDVFGRHNGCTSVQGSFTYSYKGKTLPPAAKVHVASNNDSAPKTLEPEAQPATVTEVVKEATKKPTSATLEPALADVPF